jgi:hypothetical protein
MRRNILQEQRLPPLLLDALVPRYIAGAESKVREEPLPLTQLWLDALQVPQRAGWHMKRPLH